MELFASAGGDAPLRSSAFGDHSAAGIAWCAGRGMDIRDLMYLEASAVAGNFTRAAKSLGLQTSTVSRRVGRAEDELGVTLFERNHTGIRLTAGGKAVLPHIRGALAELDALRKVGEQAGSDLSGGSSCRAFRRLHA